ncbi:hypothetical protein [Halofilum ochraceum]|uniref:hypothetical protein n=1 Tax=Halofilum ochraceum TaxID=1611323 RepID=UPI0008DB1CB9|nr:hypothetical protein [Halofilum ochraceum]
MDENEAAQLRKAVLDAVEKQITDGEPPETAETLERLVGEGYPRNEAVLMIGHVLAVEMFGIMKEERGFDHAGYARALSRLPQLPGDSPIR